MSSHPHKGRVITSILSGQDIYKLDEVLHYYNSNGENMSVSALIRILIQREYKMIKKEPNNTAQQSHIIQLSPTK